MRQHSLAHAVRLAFGLLASSQVLSQDQAVSLADVGVSQPGFRIDGAASMDQSGRSVAMAGDVNGDGLEDLIVGAFGADPGGDADAGASYVVFGKADFAAVDLGNLGAAGFRIDGIDPGDESGFAVAGAGDVNGDGLDDVIIGARFASPGGINRAGEAYLVFGKADGAPVDLANLGSGGFRLDGIDAEDYAGHAVGGGGDINGDGLDDLIVSAYRADPVGSGAGEIYVVFGKGDTNPIDLGNLGAGGFRLEGGAGDLAGDSVSGAGDVNGDGLADLIIGAPEGDPGGTGSAGESFVIFGKMGLGTVDLTNLGTAGFRIDGIAFADRSGKSVAGAGDVNGDGLDDVMVGAPFADPRGDGEQGEAYVVFGKPDPGAVDLANLGAGGFELEGIDDLDQAGLSVTGAGDFNGDGLADVVVGAFAADPGGLTYGGESYLVFGKADGDPVDLAKLGAGGLRIDGAALFDASGISVGGGGDVNGDGLSDLIIGASGADPQGLGNEGASYVLFGAAVPVALSVPPPDGLAMGDRFGGAAAADGNLVAMGLPGSDTTSPDGGRVVIYRSEGSRLVQDQLIDIPEGFFATGFGASLDLEGTRLVVGAPGSDSGAVKGELSALQAAVFERANNGDWTLKATLVPLNGNPGDQFGAAVALDGDMIVVGAPGDADGSDSGAVHVYEFANDVAVQMDKLKPETGNSGAAFGASVAAEKGRIAVGAPGSRIGQAVTGAVSVFEQVAGNLTELGTMTGSQSAASDAFGTAVALSGSMLVVGAPGEDGDGADQGATYVFDADNLSERSRIVAESPLDNARFGQAIDVNAANLAIGVPGQSGGGAAFVFDAADFRRTRIILARPGQSGLGSAITLAADALAVGAPDSANQRGAALSLRTPTLIYRTGFE